MTRYTFAAFMLCFLACHSSGEEEDTWEEIGAEKGSVHDDDDDDVYRDIKVSGYHGIGARQYLESFGVSPLEDDQLNKPCLEPCTALGTPTGKCQFCGLGVCCRKVDWQWTTKTQDCDGTIGGSGKHTCVEPPMKKQSTEGQEPCYKTWNGNAKGAPCSFPFTYNGREYNRCITINHSRPWCGTGRKTRPIIGIFMKKDAMLLYGDCSRECIASRDKVTGMDAGFQFSGKNALLEAYNHGKGFSGELLSFKGGTGGVNLAIVASALKAREVSISLSRQGTVRLKITLVLGFESLLLKDMILQIPAVRGRPFNYLLQLDKACASKALRIAVDIEFTNGEWVADPKALKWGCEGEVNDRLPLKLTLSAGSGAEAAKAGSKLGNQMKEFMRKLASSLVNKALGFNAVEAKLKPIVAQVIKNLVGNWFTNPYEGVTSASWAARPMDKATYEEWDALSRLPKPEAEAKWRADVLTAGPQAIQYDLWQLIQPVGSGLVEWYGGDAKLRESGVPKASAERGRSKASSLFEPMLVLKDFQLKIVELEFKNFYASGHIKATLHVDIDGKVCFSCVFVFTLILRSSSCACGLVKLSP